MVTVNLEQEKTNHGIKITYQGEIVGWLTTRPNGKFGFISTLDNFSSVDYDSYEESCDGFLNHFEEIA